MSRLGLSGIVETKWFNVWVVIYILIIDTRYLCTLQSLSRVSWFKPCDGSAQGMQAVFNKLNPGTLMILDKAVYFFCTGRYRAIKFIVCNILTYLKSIYFLISLQLNFVSVRSKKHFACSGLVVLNGDSSVRKVFYWQWQETKNREV